MIEIHGADELIRDFTQAGMLAAVKARTELDDAGKVVAEKARDRAPKRRPQLAPSITHELTGPLEVEVGPENARGGGYGHIIEKGLAGRAPQPFLAPALDEAAMEIDKAFGDMVEGLL